MFSSLHISRIIKYICKEWICKICNFKQKKTTLRYYNVNVIDIIFIAYFIVIPSVLGFACLKGTKLASGYFDKKKQHLPDIKLLYQHCTFFDK